MFDGVPAEQFHQFIASRASSLPLPLSFPPLHGSSNTAFSSFDHQLQQQQQPPNINFLHHSSASKINQEAKGENSMVNLQNIEQVRSIQQRLDPWSNYEVLALLRIRSTMDHNWFPEFTWEHVSRKLAEMGFKRSAEKCKEKFEEESRYLNNINYSKNHNFRVFGELEQLYSDYGDDSTRQNQVSASSSEKNKKAPNQQEEKDKIDEQNMEEEDSRIDQTVMGNYPTEEDSNGKQIERAKNKKRKRQKKFEMFKGFCEDIISKIIAQQEEMHNKLIEDMVKRDEEKVAEEEAWKKQEMDRINKELELRAQEQKLAGDRQSTIINFLKKVSSSSSSTSSGSSVELSNPSVSVVVSTQNPNSNYSQAERERPILTAIPLGNQSSSCPSSSQAKSKPISVLEKKQTQNPSSSSFSLAMTPQNPKVVNTETSPSSLKPSIKSTLSNEKDDLGKRWPKDDLGKRWPKDDLGKRWPKDEVLALINLRCSLCNSANEEKEIAATTVKAPLWERISQGMMELGYKRSAKRCKEKWENINKYFRKTKDVNKKRSVDSRTCPYFHQLSTLYNQGTLGSPSSEFKAPEKQPPGNHTATKLISSSVNINGSSNTTMHGHVEGEKNLVQAATSFDFDF